MTKKEKLTTSEIVSKLRSVKYNAEGCYETSNTYNFKVIAQDVSEIINLLNNMLK